jgi:hypothetical protein
VIGAPTGSGKTEAAARHVAQVGKAIWLADRHESIDAAVAKIEQYGGSVGRILPVDGSQSGVPNCLHSGTIKLWQSKGYPYRPGFCQHPKCCERAGDPAKCPFLASLDALEYADTIAATKAMARVKRCSTSR